MEDDIYKEIVHFHSVSEGKYPDRICGLGPVERNNAKSNFRQAARPYNVSDGVLMHKNIKVLVKSSLANVLSSFHINLSTGRHIGRDKMYDNIKELYYWRGMKSQINEYIQSCPKCTAAKPKTITVNPPIYDTTASTYSTITVCARGRDLTKMSTTTVRARERYLTKMSRYPTKVWSQVSIDIVRPLQETSQGKRYIVVATDDFSKWTEAAAITDKTPEIIGNFLFSIICRFGCMDIIFTKEGSEFNKDLLDILLDRFKIEHNIKSAAFDDHCDGENQTLIEALSLLENEHGDEWDLYIPGVLLTHHSSINVSTKTSPFEMIYGRKIKLPFINKSPVHITDVNVEINMETDECVL